MTRRMTSVTEGKALVTEGKTLVTDGKTLVTQRKTLVTKGKTMGTKVKKERKNSGVKVGRSPQMPAGLRVERPNRAI